MGSVLREYRDYGKKQAEHRPAADHPCGLLLGQHGHFCPQARRLGIHIGTDRIHPHYPGRTFFLYPAAHQGQIRFQDPAAGYPAVPGAGIREHPVFYGLYSILGTVALRKYSPYAVTAYTFLIAACGSLMICDPSDMASKFTAAPDKVSLLLFCALTALVTAVVPFLCYTLGLSTVEASRAGILATVEPMVATLVGILVFSEPLTLPSALGIALILAAVVMLNLKKSAGKQETGAPPET
ncbi:MAG: DMT family transporter [Clostridia bacterium]|nr:DMT family transporter [Clostridia bacterium]